MAADSGWERSWKGREIKSGEQRIKHEEENNKEWGSVGGQIKSEQQVGSGTAELTKTRK